MHFVELISWNHPTVCKPSTIAISRVISRCAKSKPPSHFFHCHQQVTVLTAAKMHCSEWHREWGQRPTCPPPCWVLSQGGTALQCGRLGVDLLLSPLWLWHLDKEGGAPPTWVATAGVRSSVCRLAEHVREGAGKRWPWAREVQNSLPAGGLSAQWWADRKERPPALSFTSIMNIFAPIAPLVFKEMSWVGKVEM